MIIGWIKNMAKSNLKIYNPTLHSIKKRTSIGNSVRSHPKNKSKRRSWKKYKGQGN